MAETETLPQTLRRRSEKLAASYPALLAEAERVAAVVAGKRQIANLVLPKSSSIGDLDAAQLQDANATRAKQFRMDLGKFLSIQNKKRSRS